jgi:hypothetical protein
MRTIPGGKNNSFFSPVWQWLFGPAGTLRACWSLCVLAALPCGDLKKPSGALELKLFGFGGVHSGLHRGHSKPRAIGDS